VTSDFVLDEKATWLVARGFEHLMLGFFTSTCKRECRRWMPQEPLHHVHKLFP
jgi:hypothetical protein